MLVFKYLSTSAFQHFSICDCFTIPRERLDHLDIPNPPDLRPTKQPTAQHPEYIAYPDFFSHMLDWKGLGNLEFGNYYMNFKIM